MRSLRSTSRSAGVHDDRKVSGFGLPVNHLNTAQTNAPEMLRQLETVNNSKRGYQQHLVSETGDPVS
eukprot:4042677-Amphidinium_carterae.1